MKRLVLALTAALVCIGCDRAADETGGVDSGAETAPSASPAGGPPSSAATSGAGAAISAAYLDGPWCYLYYQAGDERSDERIDYVFNQDGTLLYQNNLGTPVDRSGVWKLEDGGLSVGPAVWTISTRVHSRDSDRFVLGNDHVQAVFARGPCQREATS